MFYTNDLDETTSSIDNKPKSVEIDQLGRSDRDAVEEKISSPDVPTDKEEKLSSLAADQTTNKPQNIAKQAGPSLRRCAAYSAVALIFIFQYYPRNFVF